MGKVSREQEAAKRKGLAICLQGFAFPRAADVRRSAPEDSTVHQATASNGPAVSGARRTTSGTAPASGRGRAGAAGFGRFRPNTSQRGSLLSSTAESIRTVPHIRQRKCFSAASQFRLLRTRQLVDDLLDFSERARD